MRKTFGKFVQRYLYDKRLGDRKVVAIYRDGVKIWPTLSDTAYSMVIDMNALNGSVNRAWLLHALDAVKQMGVSLECYMKLRAGGRDYMLGATFDDWYLAEYDGNATVVFGDNGPLMENLRPGDEVSVELRVPARESAEFEGQCVCYLPHLTGTQMRVVYRKDEKDRWAGRRFTVTGQEGDVVHWGGSCETSEHKRHTHRRLLPGWTKKWRHRVHDDTMVAGETQLNIDTTAIGSAKRGLGGVTFLWPGFTTRLRFKVSAVVRHD